MDFKKLNWHAFPIALIVVAVYLAIGFSLEGKSEYAWHPTWLIFFAIPLYHWCVDMIKNKRVRGLPTFLSLVVSLTIFVVVGLTAKNMENPWHPTWLVFFIVPITGGLESFLAGGLKGQVKRAGEKIKNKILSDDDVDGHADIE